MAEPDIHKWLDRHAIPYPPPDWEAVLRQRDELGLTKYRPNLARKTIV
jgi:hypothetical protein